MSKKTIFLGGSTGRLKTEFDERLKYKNMIDFPGMIDTLYDRYSYGLVNEAFEPVYLVNDPEILSSFPGFAPQVNCLSFTAAAFEALRADYLAKVNNTDRNIPPFFNGIVPVLGHESFEQSYADYITYNSVKYSDSLQNNRTVDDYPCYLSALKEIMVQYLKDFPITRSGFLLSRHNNVRSSGIVLELAKLDYNRDFEKGEIVQSKDFRCFADYAASYGFYIDKFNPWRLYTNLEHPITRSFIRRGTVANTVSAGTPPSAEGVMNSIYRLKSHEDDLYDLQDFVVKIYNDIKKVVPFYTKSVYNGRDVSKSTESVYRPEIEMLSSAEWLEMLLLARFLELNVYTESEFENRKKQVLQVNQIYGVKSAIQKIGRICSNVIREKYGKKENNSTP